MLLLMRKNLSKVLSKSKSNLALIYMVVAVLKMPIFIYNSKVFCVYM